MATAGATRIPILELSSVTEIPTATKMAVFGDPDGNGIRLLGYMDMGFVPLGGTEVDKPITGNLEFSGDNYLFTEHETEGRTGLYFENDGGDVYCNLYYLNKVDEIMTNAVIRKQGFFINSDEVDFSGILGNAFFNKLNDRNAFAQLGDIQNASGIASYTDTAYTSGAPFTVLSGVTAALPNNAGTVYDDQKPDDIATFYDGTEITGRDGDGLSIMIYFKCTPSSINSELDIWIDIGGAVGELYRETKYFRGTTVKSVLYTLPAGYTRATWEANGGTIYVKPSVNMTFYGMNYNFLRTHKAKPVI